MRLFKSASPLVFANLVASGINFVILPIIAFHVTKEDFSTYAALTSIQAALTVIVLSTFGTSCVQVILEDNQRETWKICILTERLFLLAAAICFPIICMSVWGVISEKVYDAELVLVLAFAGGILFRSEGTIAAICRSNGKISLLAVSQVISSVIKLFLVIAIIYTRKSIALLVFSTALCDLLLAIFLQRALNLGFLTLSIKSNNYCQKLVGRARTLSLGNVSDSLVSNLDRLVIGYALSPGDIGSYHIMRKLSGILGMLTTPLNQYLLPVFTAQKFLIKNKIYEVTVPLIFFFAAVSALAITFYDFYSHYIFQDPDKVRVEFFVLIAFQMIATSFCSVHPAMIALGRLSLASGIAITSNIAFVISALLLTEKLGLIGMVLAIGIQFFFSIASKAIFILRAK